MARLAQVKVSLADVNNVTITSNFPGKKGKKVKGAGRGATDIALNGMIYNDISRRDRKVAEPLNHILTTSKKTGKVTKKSLAPLVDLANLYMGTMLDRIGTTLNTQSAFPSIRTATQTVHIKGPRLADSGPKGLSNLNWPELSPSYLYVLGVLRMRKGELVDSGKASAANKRFWYERRRAGSPFNNRTKPHSRALGKNAEVNLGWLSEQFEYSSADSGAAKPTFKRGRVNSFTAGSDIRKLEYGKKRTPKRSYRKKSGAVVFAVKGTLIGPSKLDMGGLALQDEFTDMVLQSFQNGVTGGGSPGIIGPLAQGEKDYWLYNLLKNESQRGWIRAYSVRSGSKFVQWLGVRAKRIQLSQSKGSRRIGTSL